MSSGFPCICPQINQESTVILEPCITDIERWTSASESQLKLNMDKTALGCEHSVPTKPLKRKIGKKYIYIYKEKRFYKAE